MKVAAPRVYDHAGRGFAKAQGNRGKRLEEHSARGLDTLRVDPCRFRREEGCNDAADVIPLAGDELLSGTGCVALELIHLIKVLVHRVSKSRVAGLGDRTFAERGVVAL